MFIASLILAVYLIPLVTSLMYLFLFLNFVNIFLHFLLFSLSFITLHIYISVPCYSSYASPLCFHSLSLLPNLNLPSSTYSTPACVANCKIPRHSPLCSIIRISCPISTSSFFSLFSILVFFIPLSLILPLLLTFPLFLSISVIAYLTFLLVSYISRK